MAKPSRIPEGMEYRKAWARLDRAARRRVTRGVNRGRPLEKRSEAALAVALARSQQRFWRTAWLLGPVIGAVLNIGRGWEAMVVNAAIAGLMFGALGFFFHRRAMRAEAANLQVVDPKARRQRAVEDDGKGKGRPKDRKSEDRPNHDKG